MTIYRPPQVTEREPDGEWEDCTWCSGVMFANAANERERYPSTQREYETLRAASGDSMEGGSNLFDLERGMARRYGWSVDPQTGFDAWWADMTPGTGSVLQGLMGALSDHLRRWDDFTGAHAVYCQREDTRDRVWWMNPLAPKAYAGEWVSKTACRAYYNAQPGAHWVTIPIGVFALPDSSTEDELPVAVNEPLDATIGLKVGIGLYESPDGTLLRKVNATDPATVAGLFRAESSWIAIAIPSTTTPPARLVYVKRAEVTVTRADCSAAIAADRAKAYVAWKP